MGSTPAVVLCDLPNLQRQSFIMGGRDFPGNKRMIDCLDSICEYMGDQLELTLDNKWLFGDTWMYDYMNVLLACYGRGWKYVSCPRTTVGEQVSLSDEILRNTFNMFMRSMPDHRHYVFISDDGDFIPEMEVCRAHGYDVTLFVSGSFDHRSYQDRLQLLKEKGINVVSILEDVLQEKEPKQLAQQPADKPEPQEEPPEVPLRETPAWLQSKPLLSPVERFQQRYRRA